MGYWTKKAFMVAMLFLVIGGINMGLVALRGQDMLVNMFGKQSLILNGVLIAIGLSALGIAFYRDTYLPFLGPAVIPCSVLKEVVPEGADFSVAVRLQPGVKVIYWAAEPDTKALETLNDWRKAYLEYNNAGVAIANEYGTVTLKVRKPQPYSVPFKGKLSPHIHYRTCIDNGFVGRVETVSLDGNEYFDNIQNDPNAAHIDALKMSEKEPNADIETETHPIDKIVDPDTAIEEINRDMNMTLDNNKMVESGAPETKRAWGTDITTAYNI